MIITCPSCNKKFEINATLIPKEGRNLQCGSCNHVWFYRGENILLDKPLTNETKNKNKFPYKKQAHKKDKLIKKNLEKNDPVIKNALIKYESTKKITFGNLLSYFIVFIISFIALIIVLETFKSPLEKYFPNLELILYNLYQSVDDIILFLKDLI